MLSTSTGRSLNMAAHKVTPDRSGVSYIAKARGAAEVALYHVGVAHHEATPASLIGETVASITYFRSRKKRGQA